VEETDTYLPVVTGVAVVGDRVLRLLFSDGMGMRRSAPRLGVLSGK